MQAKLPLPEGPPHRQRDVSDFQGGSPATDPGAEQNRRAFLNNLFRLHYSELVGRLRKIYGAGPPEPEDIAQGAFSKLAELENLDRIRSPRAFLFRTAINLGLNSTDKLKRGRNFLNRQMDSNFSPKVEENSPESVFIGKQDLHRVAQAIRQLPPKQKEILLRSRFRGQTYAQIRQETGWSEADISRQLNKIMELLQAELDP